MATTQGFQLVAEVQQSFILQVVQAAYDSSKIPHSTPIPAGTMFGPYQVSQGTVNIPRTGLGVNMVPAQNSVQLVLGNTEIQVSIANPPIPSATMFDMTADIDLTLPVGTLPNSINVGVLTGLPRANVTVSLTSGDPVSPLTLTAIKEYVDAQYQSGAIPHSITKSGASFGAFTADAYATISDDPTDPSNQIDTTQPSANSVMVSIRLICLPMSNRLEIPYRRRSACRHGSTCSAAVRGARLNYCENHASHDRRRGDRRRSGRLRQSIRDRQDARPIALWNQSR